MDSTTFFREATLTICSSHDADVFLFESFQYLKSAIDLPADYANIVYLSDDFCRLNVLAVTSDKMGLMYTDSVEIPREMRAQLPKLDGLPDVIISNSLNEHPLAGIWGVKGYDVTNAQLSLRLSVGGRKTGAVNFLSYFYEKNLKWFRVMKSSARTRA